MRILLAEDNAIVRKAVAAGLLADGYDVDEAEDGEKALQTARATHPDLIVSDVLMPKMDGFSLCQEIRDDQQLHDVPVVFYSSAFLDPEDEALARYVGASGFILKDTDPKTFHDQLHEIIEAEAKAETHSFHSFPAVHDTASRRHQSALMNKLYEKVAELEDERQALHEHKRFLDHILTTIPDVVFALKLPDLDMSYIAPQAERLLGYPGDELMRDPASWRKLVAEEDSERVMHEIQAAVAEMRSATITGRMKHNHDGYRWTEAHISPRFDSEGRPVDLVGSLIDISERVEAEEQIKQSEQRFRNLFEMMETGMSVHELVYDENGKAIDYRFLDVNPSFERLTGLKPEQVIGRTVREALPGIEDDWISDYVTVAQTGKAATFVRYSAPLKRYYHVVAYQTQKDQFATVFSDVSEQMRAEEKIRNLARFPEENPNPVMRVDAQGEMRYSNPASKELLQYCQTQGGHDVCPEFVSMALHALVTGKLERVEQHIGDKYYSFVVTPIKEAGYANLYGLDITQRIVAQQQLERTNRVLRTLSKSDRTLIHAATEEELLANVCQVLVEEGRYPFVWTAYSEANRRLRPLESCGEHVEAMAPWLDGLGNIDLDEHVLAELYNSNSSTPLLLSELDHGRWTEEQKKALQQSGYKALLLLPLRFRDMLFGVVGIFSATRDIFDATELALLQEMTGDIAYGIQALRTQQAHEKGMERIQATMFQTIQAVSLTLEKRDPYTAGHQQRVVQLAVAIAQDMGMSEQRIEGLRLAALVHDIGKIHVPAEILNRPGRLTDTEFGIIKSHPQVGYDILKGVEFDWPIADIVLQHHERCDGTGYPNGLTREQIVLEARIIAAADVVEAITAHRPYRPGLGIDVALQELEEGRGTRYDEEVVDTCLRLFREKDFTWSEVFELISGPQDAGPAHTSTH